jgi:hypothetical protein
MWKAKLVWHLIVVFVVEFLPYNYSWLMALLRDGQPLAIALTTPLFSGELFRIAGIIWLLSVGQLFSFGITTPHAALRIRIHLMSLMGVSFAALIPLIVFAATDNGAPLKGFGIGCEKITIGVIIVFSIWVCVFRHSHLADRDVILSPYLFRRR